MILDSKSTCGSLDVVNGSVLGRFGFLNLLYRSAVQLGFGLFQLFFLHLALGFQTIQVGGFFFQEGIKLAPTFPLVIRLGSMYL